MTLGDVAAHKKMQENKAKWKSKHKNLLTQKTSRTKKIDEIARQKHQPNYKTVQKIQSLDKWMPKEKKSKEDKV